ncbi:hypothetical protein IF2G_05644 [Cordyceps javanica]|nr:hypothetical protein IF2G_05644 [Cordyceps javanica]
MPAEMLGRTPGYQEKFVLTEYRMVSPCTARDKTSSRRARMWTGQADGAPLSPDWWLYAPDHMASRPQQAGRRNNDAGGWWVGKLGSRDGDGLVAQMASCRCRRKTLLELPRFAKGHIAGVIHALDVPKGCQQGSWPSGFVKAAGGRDHTQVYLLRHVATDLPVTERGSNRTCSCAYQFAVRGSEAWRSLAGMGREHGKDVRDLACWTS